MKAYDFKDSKITDIQLFDYALERQIGEYEYEIVYSYSANVVIDDKFIIQVYGDKNESGYDIPCSYEASWNDSKIQDFICENIDKDDIIELLEQREGFENNIGWIEDHATNIMNPENAKYRQEG